MNRIGRYLLAVTVLGICFYGCTGSHKTAKDGLKQGQVWKIVKKITMTPLPEATHEEMQKFKENRAKADSARSIILLSDSLYKTRLTGEYQQIRIRRDSIMYMLNEENKTAYRFEVDKWLKSKRQKKDRYAVFKLFPDSTKTILGRLCHKAVFRPTYGDSSITYTAWYATDFPSWIWDNIKGKKIPGIMLEMSFVKDNIKITVKAMAIKKIPVDPTVFKVPEGYRILNADGSVYKREVEKQKKAYKTSHDSLLSVLQSIKPDKVYEEGSVFKYGFARVEVDDSTHYYVDMAGAYAFDQIISTYHPIDKITPARPGFISIDRNKSVTMLIVQSKGKLGLISSKTGWVLPAQYSGMRIEFDRYLSLAKNGKQGYADTWGNILVPVKFNDVKIMDNYHYDVKIGEKWGIYHAKKKKLIIPAIYDEFDFCGGCGGEVGYAYAKKNGKWGILAFDGTVLLPFKYGGHSHSSMRSDNWVTNFEIKGKDVMINMIGDKVYSPPEYTDMRVISGVLAAKKDGKYGLINDQNEVILPFKYDDIEDAYGLYQWGPYIEVHKNGKAGIATNTGKMVIKPSNYDGFIATENGYFNAFRGSQQVLVDSSGQLISPKNYDIDGISSPKVAYNAKGKEILLFVLDEKDLEGIFNLNTQTVIKPRFSSVDVVSPDSIHYFIEVEIEEKGKGLYSLKGRELMSPKYNDYEFLSSEMVRVRNQDFVFGIFSLRADKVVLPLIYKSISPITPRYYLLRRQVDSVMIEKIWDAKQQTFLNLKQPYDHITKIGSPFIAVYDTAHAYLYNLEKRTLISGKTYDFFGYFRHGLIEVRKNDKYGFINAAGEVVIPLKYDKVDRTKHGVIKLFIKINDHLWKYGFADSTGTLLTPIKYSFYDGSNYTIWSDTESDYLKISIYNKQLDKNLFGMMTLDGKEIVPPKYNKIYVFTNGKGFLIKSNLGWGILDETGKVLVPPVLDNIYFNETSLGGFIKNIQYPVLCELDGHYFYVTHSGKILPFSTTGRIRFQNRYGWRY